MLEIHVQRRTYFRKWAGGFGKSTVYLPQMSSFSTFWKCTETYQFNAKNRKKLQNFAAEIFSKCYFLATNDRFSSWALRIEFWKCTGNSLNFTQRHFMTWQYGFILWQLDKKITRFSHVGFIGALSWDVRNRLKNWRSTQKTGNIPQYFVFNKVLLCWTYHLQ